MVHLNAELEERVRERTAELQTTNLDLVSTIEELRKADAVRSEFIAMAKALTGGSGWVILAWSERLGQLVNHWAADHAHCLPGAAPILALDMYEHAYQMDYGAAAGKYVDAFMQNVNWEEVNRRVEMAQKMTIV